jgi:hypothetical protein
MLSEFWGACANALEPERTPSTAVPPAPTRNSRRLGAIFVGSVAVLSEFLDLFFLFIVDIPLQRMPRWFFKTTRESVYWHSEVYLSRAWL